MNKVFHKDNQMDLIIDLYEEFEIDGPAPDPFEIFRKMDVRTATYSSTPKKTLLKKMSDECVTLLEPDGFVVYYNDRSKSKERIRYSMFHEMAHIVLGHFENTKLSEDEKEFQADRFVSMFSVPFTLIKYYEITTIKQMMNTFKISYENACIQLERYLDVCNGREYKLSKKEKRLIEVIEGNKIKHNKN